MPFESGNKNPCGVPMNRDGARDQQVIETSILADGISALARGA
jgi:hypothetical protein